MNAKITITVPIEKLNSKVADIIESVASDLDFLSVDVTAISKAIIQENDLLKQLNNIDLARKKLALLDANLEDCYSILSGLVKYKTNQATGQKNAEQPTE